MAALSDSPTDCGLLLASTTGVTFVSPLLGRLTLRPIHGLLESYGDLFHPDEQDLVVDYVDRLFAHDDRPVCATLRIARGDGSWGRFAIATANLLDDPDFRCFVTLIRALDAGVEEPGPAQIESARSRLRDAGAAPAYGSTRHNASSAPAHARSM